MHPPTITVAVPTCNGALHLRETLVSILSSGGYDELLIVDDRSDDSTVAIAESFIGDIGRVIVNPERLGLASNWNRCVALSQNSLVAIFHQDDLMLPGHLQTHLEAYQRNPEFGWVASQAQVIDSSGALVASEIVDPGGLGDQDLDLETHGADRLAISNPLRCSAVSINRAAHAEVGGFDPSYRYVVDWDFWLRVAQSRPVAWKARTTVAIRWHKASETHRFATGTVDLDETARLMDRLSEHFNQDRQTTLEWRRAVDRRLARAFLNRAHVAYKQGNILLARRAFTQSVRLSPRSMFAVLARDPRLVAQMGVAFLSPQGTKR